MEMENSYNNLRKLIIDGFTRLNKTDKVETKKWEFPAGSWEIKVVRGNVLEKATAARIILNTVNPATGDDTKFDILQVKTYPANPKVPILLFNMENRAAKNDIFGGFLDVAPVAAAREDITFMQNEIKKVTGKHGVDYEPLRKDIESIYKMDQWEKPLNAGVGIRLNFSAEQVDVVKDAGLTWVESYFSIVEKRASEPFDPDEEACMNSVRTGLLAFYMLKDMSFKVSQKLGVPLEALTLNTLAPTIRY